MPGASPIHPPPASCYEAASLLDLATSLLTRAGLAPDRAHAVADVLLAGDLLGHSTHGLDLLAPYLKELDEGRMAREGEPETLSDLGSAVTWDGRRLPGPWLVRKAITLARARVPLHHVVTVVIRRSHHIACLEAYLEEATEHGLLMILTSSDPAAGGVTPHGGVGSRITPNPIAAGIPTGRDPILIDVSMSTTTNAMTKRMAAEGRRLPGPWLVDAHGRATDDPGVLTGETPGAVLPLGGLDLGHKGFALGLLAEALTSGLAGYGRADQPRQWGASVFLQLIDPEAFGGRAAFQREMGHTSDICREAPVAQDRPPVRLPGEAALARRSRQLREGVALYQTTMPALSVWAERYQVPLPEPMRT